MRSELQSLLKSYFLDDLSNVRKIGLELEQIAVDKLTGRRLSHEEHGHSTGAFMKRYRNRRGGELVAEGPNVVGVTGEWGELSLEGGGQVEWASPPMATFSELAIALAKHQAVASDIAGQLGLRWLETAVDPVTRLDEVTWVPKERVAALRAYYSRTGPLGEELMTQSASVQCAVDYSSEADWLEKFRVAMLLTPVAAALFANSRRYGGRDTGFASYRQVLWMGMDRQRCLIPDVVFEPDFSLNAWIAWVCQLPIIFRVRGEQAQRSDVAIPFERLCDELEDDREILENWQMHLSTVMTPVRSYRYLELRSADLPPQGNILAVPAFWYGIMYGPGSLEQAAGLAAQLDDRTQWWRTFKLAYRGDPSKVLRELTEAVAKLSLASLASLGVDGSALERALGAYHARFE